MRIRGTTHEGPFMVAIPYKNVVRIGLRSFQVNKDLSFWLRLESCIHSSKISVFLVLTPLFRDTLFMPKRHILARMTSFVSCSSIASFPGIFRTQKLWKFWGSLGPPTIHRRKPHWQIIPFDPSTTTWNHRPSVLSSRHPWL